MKMKMKMTISSSFLRAADIYRDANATQKKFPPSRFDNSKVICLANIIPVLAGKLASDEVSRATSVKNPECVGRGRGEGTRGRGVERTRGREDEGTRGREDERTRGRLEPPRQQKAWPVISSRNQPSATLY
ncbi:hypothetical protein L207DRAFT_64623 [Hyaloscypha variabilis F]|uniref:Uncharacterized protein n=1 Tax=Hyaloscypha variabilis (strain UAMH 11265 / GT02V1 / F) TaxID=1149755 RepID=A0A2J6RI95_HYAVF|nr:hypothetical protein L207DRAFT_64623 [Hyaloscypha variabilis F]